MTQFAARTGCVCHSTIIPVSRAPSISTYFSASHRSAAHSSCSAVQHARRQTFGNIVAFHRSTGARACSARASRPGSLHVNAEGWNRLGGSDANEEDSDSGELDDGYERDTARLLLKVLTVRATQKVLMQLQELDLHVAGWLSGFCSSHPPAKGDEFLLELMKMGSAEITDKTNQMTHNVSPSDLVERILLTRTDMAARISTSFPRFVELQGRELKVKHLSNSYVSGTTPKGRGGSRRRR